MAGDPSAAARALTTFLHGRSEFRGNEADYYDPRNSFLNEVIDRRLGLPITLSILYIEVGARLGLNMRGIGLPGHFLVKLVPAGSYLDPYSGKADLDEADCMERVRAIHGDTATVDPAMFEPQSNRQILTRLLTNLRMIYRSTGDLPRARAALDRLVLLNPDGSALYRDRGEVLAAMGEYQLALKDAEQARRLQPPNRRSRRFRNWRRFVREMAARMN
jgi:regulator of sirC expression with transglutaminase-like and TPR domain